MTPGARVVAAIEVLTDIETRKRPASEALKDWGLNHRFAGSGDRAAIGLRHKGDLALMREDSCSDFDDAERLVRGRGEGRREDNSERCKDA